MPVHRVVKRRKDEEQPERDERGHPDPLRVTISFCEKDQVGVRQRKQKAVRCAAAGNAAPAFESPKGDNDRKCRQEDVEHSEGAGRRERQSRNEACDQVGSASHREPPRALPALSAAKLWAGRSEVFLRIPFWREVPGRALRWISKPVVVACARALSRSRCLSDL